MNANYGSLKNPIDIFSDIKYNHMAGYVHYYQSKGNKCFKALCVGKYVKATSLGKWERSFFLGEFRQTTSFDRITCPECLIKALPLFRNKNQKYLINLSAAINGVL